MNESIPYADILILALVAGFILLRLRSVLGTKTGDEEPRAQKRRELMRQVEERIVQVADKNRAQIIPPQEKPVDPSLVEPSAQNGIDQIRATDTSFRADEFLEGAKVAFEMVFTAFNKGDKATLKSLFSDSLFQTFSEEIDQRAKLSSRQENTLVAIDSAHIVAAEKERNMARITVRFVSEQINVERDEAGKITGGDPSQIDKVENEWVFERDLNSKNPNWKVIDT